MNPRTLVADRFAALVAAVLALALGVLAILWWTGRWSALGQQVDASATMNALDQPWWPWAVGLAGVILGLLGLRWLVAHLRSQGVGRLTLPGSSKAGRLTAEAKPVAKAAGDRLGKTRGVRSARATLTHDRGQIVARFTATVDPDADLALVASAADQVSAELRQVLGRDDVMCRVQLKVSARTSTIPRVA